jgi:hypothetical protein
MGKDSQSILGRLAGFFFGSKEVAAADPDKVRRDFLYPTAAGPLYFSRNAARCRRFGWVHGDVLAYGAGHVLRGAKVAVVGERGGRLWVARATTGAQSSSSSRGDDDAAFEDAFPLEGADKVAVQLKYQFNLVGHKVLRPVSASTLGRHVAAEHREFLMNAPDLEVALDGAAAGAVPVRLLPAVGDDGAMLWSGTGSTAGPDGSLVSVSATVSASDVLPNAQ